MNDWRPRQGYLIYDGTYGKLMESDDSRVLIINGVDVTLCWSGTGVSDSLLQNTAEALEKERINGHTTTRGAVGHRARAGETT